MFSQFNYCLLPCFEPVAIGWNFTDQWQFSCGRDACRLAKEDSNNKMLYAPRLLVVKQLGASTIHWRLHPTPSHSSTPQMLNNYGQDMLKTCGPFKKAMATAPCHEIGEIYLDSLGSRPICAYLCIQRCWKPWLTVYPLIRKARMQWNTSTQRQSLLISHPKSGFLHRCTSSRDRVKWINLVRWCKMSLSEVHATHALWHSLVSVITRDLFAMFRIFSLLERIIVRESVNVMHPMFTTLAKPNALVKFSLSMLKRLLGLNVCHVVSSCFMLIGRVTLEDNVLMLVMSCLDPSWPSNGSGWCHVPHEQQKNWTNPTMFWSYPSSLSDNILMIHMIMIENVLCNMYTILRIVWDWVGETLNPKVSNS